MHNLQRKASPPFHILTHLASPTIPSCSHTNTINTHFFLLHTHTESSISPSMSIDSNNNETLIPVNGNQNQNQPMDSNSESAYSYPGSWSSSSSSSFLTTSFGSELDSNDVDLDSGDEDEFIAQLTRRMADYMFEENDDAGRDENRSSKQSSIRKLEFQERKNHEQTRRSYADTVKKSIVGFQSEQKFTGNEQLQPPIQVYQVDNQPRVGGQGRKGKMSESTQQMKPHRHEQMHSNRGFRGGKEFVNSGKGYCGVPGSSMAVGSGMRAIFLGGSGSRNMLNGTGVFLPRSSTDATDHSRKKPGCSTVLVPTRVLQALEHHFNNIESLSSSNKLAPRTHHVNKEKTQTQESVSVDHQGSELPQDWIY